MERRCLVRTRTWVGASSVALGCLWNTTAIGDEDLGPLRILSEWIAPEGASERQFGHAVAIEGDLIVVATDGGDKEALSQGVVRLLERNTTVPAGQKVLSAPDRRWPDRFGAALAIDGTRLLVGAPQDAEHGWDSGAAWLFEHGTAGWRLEERLEPDTVEAGAQFGAVAALQGNIAVIGAPRSDGTGLDNGAACIFEKIKGHWTWTTTLRAPDQDDADFFGSSVAVEDGWIAVGAWGDDDHGEKTGAVWVFQFNGAHWEPFQKLVPPEALARDRFGWEVALADGQLLVSACGVDESRGMVHVHEFDGRSWRQVQALVEPSGTSGDWFGFSLAARGTLAVIGAPGADGTTELEGRTTVYRHLGGDWERIGSISSGPGPGVQPVQFGWSVATDGSHVMVGRIDDADGPAEPGRAWLLEPGASVTDELRAETVTSTKR